MTAPFQIVYPDEIKIPATRVESLMNTYRERQRTGLVRLAYSGEKQIYLLFRRGLVLNGYMISNASSLRLENWQDTIASSPEAFARLIPLSTFALQLCKLGIESKAEQVISMSAADLRGSLTGPWKQSRAPTLIHLGWKSAEGLVFFSGEMHQEYSVFFTSSRLVDGAGITDSILLWGDPQAMVTRYSMNLAQPAWQEYFLRRAFAEVCERALSRYEKITGRPVVDSVIRSMVVAASRRSAEINITGRKLADHEIFPTPQAAAETYHDILKTMLEQLAALVGSRLSLSILTDLTSEFPEPEYRISQQFSMLPEEFHP